MSTYMGDLDLIDSTISPQDSNMVAGMNYLGDLVPTLQKQLFKGQVPMTITAKLLADSAVFSGSVTLKSLYNYDSAMPDSSKYGRWYLGDSPGTDEFDFNTDSAKFRKLTISGNLTFDSSVDSAVIGKVTVDESGYIQTLSSDSTGTVIFGRMKLRGALGKQTVIDSALVLSKITVENFISDSGSDSGVHIDSANITNLFIDSQLVFADSPSRKFTDIRPFYLTDSTGDSTGAFFGAWQLIDSI